MCSIRQEYSRCLAPLDTYLPLSHLRSPLLAQVGSGSAAPPLLRRLAPAGRRQPCMATSPPASPAQRCGAVTGPRHKRSATAATPPCTQGFGIAQGLRWFLLSHRSRKTMAQHSVMSSLKPGYCQASLHWNCYACQTRRLVQRAARTLSGEPGRSLATAPLGAGGGVPASACIGSRQARPSCQRMCIAGWLVRIAACAPLRCRCPTPHAQRCTLSHCNRKLHSMLQTLVI